MSLSISQESELEKLDDEKVLEGTIPDNFTSLSPEKITKEVKRWNDSEISFRRGIYLFSVHKWYEDIGFSSMSAFFSSNILNKSAKECYKEIRRTDVELSLLSGDFRRVGTIRDSHLDMMIKMSNMDIGVHKLEIIRSVYNEVIGKNAYDRNNIKASDFERAFVKLYCEIESENIQGVAPNDEAESKEPLETNNDDNQADSKNNIETDEYYLGDDEDNLKANEYISIPALEALDGEKYHAEIEKIQDKMVSAMSEVDVTNLILSMLEKAQITKSKYVHKRMLDFITSNRSTTSGKKKVLHSRVEEYLNEHQYHEEKFEYE